MSQTSSPYKTTQGKWIITHKQLQQLLPILLAQVQADNVSEKFFNKIWQIVCSLYWVKQLSKKWYNNLLESMSRWVQYSWILENRKIFDAQKLRINLIDKIDLRKGDNSVALLVISIYYTWKKTRKS